MLCWAYVGTVSACIRHGCWWVCVHAYRCMYKDCMGRLIDNTSRRKMKSSDNDQTQTSITHLRLNKHTDIYLRAGRWDSGTLLELKHFPQISSQTSAASPRPGETLVRYQMMLEYTLHSNLIFSLQDGSKCFSLQAKYFLCWWALIFIAGFIDSQCWGWSAATRFKSNTHTTHTAKPECSLQWFVRHSTRCKEK